jgi:hypothetical protein
MNLIVEICLVKYILQVDIVPIPISIYFILIPFIPCLKQSCPGPDGHD